MKSPSDMMTPLYNADRRVVNTTWRGESLPVIGPHGTIRVAGAMAERFMAVVLKTTVAFIVTGGSNPSRSAVVRPTGRCQRGRLEPPAKRLWD